MPANDHHGLPTPRSTLRAGYLDVLVSCKACRRRAPPDPQIPMQVRRPTDRLGGYIEVWRQTGMEREGQHSGQDDVEGPRIGQSSGDVGSHAEV